jgi:hypothetical protein
MTPSRSHKHLTYDHFKDKHEAEEEATDDNKEQLTCSHKSTVDFIL